ncbi:hypothetical protein JCM16303_000647 [Sporobolomyces ruberrimus]
MEPRCSPPLPLWSKHGSRSQMQISEDGFIALQALIYEASLLQFSIGESAGVRLVDSAQGLLSHPNGEGRSVTDKTKSVPVYQRISGSSIRTIIDRLVGLTASNDGRVRDMASSGLGMTVTEARPGSNSAATRCRNSVPEVSNQITNATEVTIDWLDLLSDSMNRFDTPTPELPNIQQKILQASVPLLGHLRAAVRKPAVDTIATLIPTTSSASKLFPTLLSDTLLLSLSNSLRSPDQLLYSISLIWKSVHPPLNSMLTSLPQSP